ncbi:MAG: preprotein translocase subunit SecG [Ignavibacteriaceae bacterium]
MYTLLVTIAAITAVLLIIVVLLQASKGSGLAGTFGGAGGSMGSMFGTRRTADFLSRATWWLGGIVAVLALVINLFFLPGKVTPEQRSIIQESGQQNIPQTPTLPQQNQLPLGTENPEGQ